MNQALQRQADIVQGLIDRSRLGMQIEGFQQVGDETPDTHIFTLSCTCQDFLHLGFDQGKDGEWVMKALNTIRSHAKMKHAPVTTAFLLWDIRFREDGEEKFIIKEDFFFEWLQQFTKDKDVTSITFYANGMSEPVVGESYERRIYEETLTAEEFAKVNQTWLQERKKKIGVA
jgi:hypothetical protein